MNSQSKQKSKMVVEEVLNFACHVRIVLLKWCSKSTASLSEHVELHSAGKMSNVKTEQRINIKFLVKLKKSATETFQMLTETYGDKTMFRAWVFKFEWHKRLSGGRDSVEEDEHAEMRYYRPKH
ncbi:HTH_48 domain-containing protein [Trichonephila clavipes]|nr:HTH_48 domain-containing protein [Trichonephila clavipes]